MYVAQRQDPLPIAQNFTDELMKNDRLLGSKAISLLRRVDQRHRVTANNCFWYAIQADKLVELVRYLEPKVLEAERIYSFYPVTGEDYQYLRTLEV
ncbi:MAG: hypothetical protein WCI63_02485 [bacterium]